MNGLAVPRLTALQRPLAVLLLACAATHGAYQLGRAYFHPKQGLDLAPSYLAGRMVLAGGHDFFDDIRIGALGASLGMHGPGGEGAPVLNFLYPPWVPALYAPLSALPWGTARRVWFLLSTLMSGAALALTARSFLPRDSCAFGTLAALGAAAFFFPLFYGLMTGQANDLLFFLVAGGLYLLARGRPLAAGAVFAPAFLWKPFLGIAVLFLLARREGKALLGLFVGAATLVAVSIGLGGAGAWLDWLRQIGLHNVLTSPEPRNHGLANAVLSLGLPPSLSPALIWGLEGLVLVLLVLLLAPRTAPGGARYALQLGGTLVAGVLLTPKAWEHYGVFLFPAFFAATVLSLEEGKTWPTATLGVCFSVWGLVLQGHDEYVALTATRLAPLVAVKTVAALALLGLAAWLVRRRPDQPSGEIGLPRR